MSTETKTLTNADAKVQPKLGVKALVQIGMLSAIAVVLMMFDIPLPFAPTFYKIDLSEVPVLVGCFAMGPMAGVLVELVKILLNFVMTGTSTAGVGEIAETGRIRWNSWWLRRKNKLCLSSGCKTGFHSGGCVARSSESACTGVISG